MSQIPESIFTIIFSVLIIWISILSVFVLRMIQHYNTLTSSASGSGLKDALDSILTTQKRIAGNVDTLASTLQQEIDHGRLHIQKIGFVRFNPFADTGGSQSFTLALLDGKDNGLVLTSLYARAGNRWYSKEIIGGKGKGVALSREEEAAIAHAQTKKHV